MSISSITIYGKNKETDAAVYFILYGEHFHQKGEGLLTATVTLIFFLIREEVSFRSQSNIRESSKNPDNFRFNYFSDAKILYL